MRQFGLKIYRYFFDKRLKRHLVHIDLYLFVSRRASIETAEKIFRILLLFRVFPNRCLAALCMAANDRNDLVSVNTCLGKILKSGKGLSVNHLIYRGFVDALAAAMDSGDYDDEITRLFAIKTVEDEHIVYSIFASGLYPRLDFARLIEVLPKAPERGDWCLVKRQIEGVRSAAVKEIVLKAAEAFEFRDPICFEDSADKKRRIVKMPIKAVWEIDNCDVVAGFQIVKGDRLIVYEDAADPRNGFVAGLGGSTTFLRNSFDEVVNDLECEYEIHLAKASLLSGRCSTNYFHWLIEYLPKMLNLIEADVDKEALLLVDSRLVSQQSEILDFLASKYAFKVFQVKPRSRIHVDKLFVPSISTFHPDDEHYEYWEGGAVSVEHLQFLQREGYDFSGVKPGYRSDKPFVYLTRKGVSENRRIVNENKIELLAYRHGFAVIDPSRLSFAEQVRLFAGAQVVVSPAGAALANVVFCQPGTQVVSLIADVNKGYSIMANMSVVLGLKFMHLTGSLIRPRKFFSSHDDYRFSEFEIDLEKAERMFVWLKKSLESPSISEINPSI